MNRLKVSAKLREKTVKTPYIPVFPPPSLKTNHNSEGVVAVFLPHARRYHRNLRHDDGNCGT